MSGKAGVGSPQAPQLSITSMFDDMCRAGNGLVDMECDTANTLLVENLERVRLNWFTAVNELRIAKDQLMAANEEIQSLNSSVTRVRRAFGKEVKQKDYYRRQALELRKQIQSIRDFVVNGTDSSQETKDRVLYYIHMDPILEKSTDFIDGNSEEDLIDHSAYQMVTSTMDLKTVVIDETMIDSEVPLKERSKRDRSHSDSDVAVDKCDHLSRKQLKSDSEFIEDLRNIARKTTAASAADLKASVAELTKQVSKSSVVSSADLVIKTHTFRSKKALIGTQCGACHQKVQFLTTYMVCEVCLGVAHLCCKERLPTPCIPFRKQQPKQRQTSRKSLVSPTDHKLMSLIADFAPDIRPMVPSLMIHVCNELEGRGLTDEGLYRKCGSDSTVKALKEKLLKVKTRTQSLETYQSHDLTNVLKKFLRELDEPLITRVLWRDFIRAADQTTREAVNDLLFDTMDQMPTANHDSLAFLMRHLHRVAANSHVNLMDAKALSRVFAPTLVGSSAPNLPTHQMAVEVKLQIGLMEALFGIPEEAYHNMIVSAELSYVRNEWSPNTRNTSKRRSQRATTGPLTPLRSKTMRPIREGGAAEQHLDLRPMF